MAAEPEVHRGEGAVLGVRVLRYSGVQAVALAAASIVQLITLFVVAHYLGAADLGRFAILYFGANLLMHLLTIAVKPGTIRRTFGAGDDEDDEDDEGEDGGASSSPKRSLGTGMVMALLLALAGSAIALILREPIADVLLGSGEDANLVAWAVLLGGVSLLYRLASIVIWFERRPGAFLAVELIRPLVALVLTIVLLAGGGGLEAVLGAATAGSAAAALVGILVLRHSFDPALDPDDVKAILHRGMLRAPIMMSFWTIGNADVFLLSRFVSDVDLGIYTLASRVGFIAAFAPQGFRVALRPLRKASIYRSVEDQYGRAEHRGQLLGYFVLGCISGVLAMVLLAPLAVDIAPESFGDATPLIPLAAAAMIMPALLRTVNQQASWPGRTQKVLILAAVFGALVFIGATLLLAPELGVYAAPVAIIVGLAPPSLWIFIRGQRDRDRIGFPYRRIATAAAVALALGATYVAIPEPPAAAEIALALTFAAVYVASLFVLDVIPRMHRDALGHVFRSSISGRPDQFRPRKGLRALDEAERAALRAAVESSWAAGARAGTKARNGAAGERPGDLVRALRAAANRGGVPIGEPTEFDAEIGTYLFSSDPTAVRNARMRKLLEDGAPASDLRTLEDIVAHLATAPPEAWGGAGLGRRR